MINLKYVSWKFLSLTDLFWAQTFYIHETLKIFMVCEYE